MVLFRCGRTQIKVHPLLLVFILLWGFSGFLLTAGAIFSALLLHELAHIGAAKFFGVRIYEMELLPFGCSAQMDDIFEHKPGQEAVIAAAGPLCSLFTGLAAYALCERYAVSGEWARFFNEFIAYSYTIAGFNLIPALPLDGGRILRAVISRKEDGGRATRLCAWLGIVFAAGLISYAAYYYFAHKEITFVPALALFLLLSAIKELKTSRFMRAKAMLSRGRGQSGDSFRIKSIAVYYDMPLSRVVSSFTDSHYYVVNIMDKNMRILGSLDEKTLEAAYLEKEGNTPVGRLLTAKSGSTAA